jgi:hypothetical protein
MKCQGLFIFAHDMIRMCMPFDLGLKSIGPPQSMIFVDEIFALGNK